MLDADDSPEDRWRSIQARLRSAGYTTVPVGLDAKGAVTRAGNYSNGTFPTLDVLFLDSSNNFLYAGGHFDTAGTIPAKNIARWDGTNWTALGNGVNITVISITVWNNDVYVCGFLNNSYNRPLA